MMKLRNKKSGDIGYLLASKYLGRYEIASNDCQPLASYDSIAKLVEEWEDYNPIEPLIKDKRICETVRAWANYNKTESVYAYNLVYDHGGVCVENALVRFYDPRLRTNIDVWFQIEAPTFKEEQEYTITELCGDEE